MVSSGARDETTAVDFPVTNERGHNRNQSRRKAVLLRPSSSSTAPSVDPEKAININIASTTTPTTTTTTTTTEINSSSALLPASVSLVLAMHSPKDDSFSKSRISKSSMDYSSNPLLSSSPSSSSSIQSNRHKRRSMLSSSINFTAVGCNPFRRLHSILLISMLALILSCCCLTTSAAFQLDGSQTSFAQFRKWYVGLNGSLELEFKTEQPNGLVLYSDDGGTYDFFELKLVEGALRLRYNLGGGAQIITVGRDLHDGHWHKVQVCLYFPNCFIWI